MKYNSAYLNTVSSNMRANALNNRNSKATLPVPETRSRSTFQQADQDNSIEGDTVDNFQSKSSIFSAT